MASKYPMEVWMKKNIMRVRALTRAKFVCLIGVAALFAPASCRAQGYTITTVAGGGGTLFNNGGPAIGLFMAPKGVAADSAGNLYIADDAYSIVYKVTPSGAISIFAGTFNQGGYSGDGFPATTAQLDHPMGMAFDPAGNLYIADWRNGRVRKVAADGIISTVAGGAATGANNRDGGQATSADLGFVWDLAVDSAGNLYIVDSLGVSKVAPDGTIALTVAGGGVTLGDGGPATSAFLYGPEGVAVDGAGNLYIADTLNNRIRKVSNGIITTFAGGGSGADNGPASQAALSGPTGVAVDTSGNVYIADTNDQRVRVVTQGGTINTIAGNGQDGYSGDGGPATSANVANPSKFAFGARGVIYIATPGINEGNAFLYSRVRMLTPTVPPVGSPPSIKAGGVVSASAFGAFTAIALGSWIEIYGSNLATDSRGWAGADFNGVNAPTSLDGTKVTIGGQPAFIDYISPGQVNAQVPSNVAAGPQPVIVTTAAGASSAYTITVNAEQPGLLAPLSFNIGGKQYAAALFSDGVTYVLPPGAIAGLASRRAQPGDSITLYGIGFGPVTPNIPAGQIVQLNNAVVLPFHVFLGQTEATVSYAGLAPNAVGLYQFNMVVPNIPASDSVPLTFTLGGVSGTQTLYIAVQ
jgi:uncharacterized protein (TIGR03437 family)